MGVLNEKRCKIIKNMINIDHAIGFFIILLNHKPKRSVYTFAFSLIDGAIIHHFTFETPVKPAFLRKMLRNFLHFNRRLKCKKV
jgi:hypothetical protein